MDLKHLDIVLLTTLDVIHVINVLIMNTKLSKLKGIKIVRMKIE